MHFSTSLDGLLTTAVKTPPRSLVEPWLNKVRCGDCVKLMERMPVGCIGLVVTSPPYNLRNSTGNGLKDGRGGKWPKAELLNGYADHGDDMPYEEYVRWQRKCLSAMMLILREDGAIFYNHKWRVQRGILQDRVDIVRDFPVGSTTIAFRVATSRAIRTSSSSRRPMASRVCGFGVRRMSTGY